MFTKLGMGGDSERGWPRPRKISDDREQQSPWALMIKNKQAESAANQGGGQNERKISDEFDEELFSKIPTMNYGNVRP